MNELQAIAKFLTETLTTDSGVAALVGDRVHEGLAPQGSGLPYVVFQHQGGPDRNSIGAHGRLFSRPLWFIKAVCGGGSFAEADAIADAVDNALEEAAAIVMVGGQDYNIRAVGRQSPAVRYPELDGGKRFNHSGGLYRIHCHAVVA